MTKGGNIAITRRSTPRGPSISKIRHSRFDTESSSAIGHRSFRHAFTVIELVLVIGIIIVLAGLLLSTAGYARKKGARARAETEIAAISAACENYKADNAAYPNSSGTGGTDGLDPSTGNVINYQMPCRYLYGEISGDRDFNGLPDTNARPYMMFKDSSLFRADMTNPPSSSNPVTAIRDPFGNSYGYSTMKASGGANGYNPTFDLWSIADGAAG